MHTAEFTKAPTSGAKKQKKTAKTKSERVSEADERTPKALLPPSPAASPRGSPRSSPPYPSDSAPSPTWGETANALQAMQEKATRAGRAAWASAAKAGESLGDSAKAYVGTCEAQDAMDGECGEAGAVASSLKEASCLRSVLLRIGYKITGASLRAGVPPAVTIHCAIIDGVTTAAEVLKSEEGQNMPMRHRAVLRCLQSVDRCKPTSKGSGFYPDFCDLRLGFIPSVEVHFALADDAAAEDEADDMLRRSPSLQVLADAPGADATDERRERAVSQGSVQTRKTGLSNLFGGKSTPKE